MGWNHQLDIPFRKLARNPQKSIVCKGVSRCQKEENFQLPFVGIFSPSHEWNLLKMKTTKCQPQELWWLFFDEGWYPIIWGYIWDLLWKITSEKHLSNNKKITNQIQGTKSPGVVFLEKNPWQKHAQLAHLQDHWLCIQVLERCQWSQIQSGSGWESTGPGCWGPTWVCVNRLGRNDLREEKR